MTGTSFIDRPLERVLGGQSGLPLLLIADWVGIRISSRFFVYIWMPLLTPSTSGRWTFSRTAWRRRRVGPRSLMASCWRPGPFTGCNRAPARLRRFWMAFGYFQDYWRAVRTLNAGDYSGFWRFCPIVQCDVGQCSAWRGLSWVWNLSHSDTGHRASFS